MSKNVLSSVYALIFLVGGAAYGHDEFPEGTLLALEGKDAKTGESCFLFVTETGYRGAEQTPDQWYAKVLTSYNSDYSSERKMSIKLDPTKPGILPGATDDDQYRVVVYSAANSVDLTKVSSFHYRWRHGNHFHTSRCLGTQVHEH